MRTGGPLIALAVLLALLAVSRLWPYGRTTWALGVAPMFVVLPILGMNYARARERRIHALERTRAAPAGTV